MQLKVVEAYHICILALLPCTRHDALIQNATYVGNQEFGPRRPYIYEAPCSISSIQWCTLISEALSPISTVQTTGLYHQQGPKFTCKPPCASICHWQACMCVKCHYCLVRSVTAAGALVNRPSSSTAFMGCKNTHQQIDWILLYHLGCWVKCWLNIDDPHYKHINLLT